MQNTLRYTRNRHRNFFIQKMHSALDGVSFSKSICKIQKECQKTNIVVGTVENILGKGENTG